MLTLSDIGKMIADNYEAQGNIHDGWEYRAFIHTHEGVLMDVTGYGIHRDGSSWEVSDLRVNEALIQYWGRGTGIEMVTFAPDKEPVLSPNPVSPLRPSNLFETVYDSVETRCWELDVRSFCVERENDTWLLHAHGEKYSRYDMACPSRIRDLIEQIWRNEQGRWCRVIIEEIKPVFQTGGSCASSKASIDEILYGVA